MQRRLLREQQISLQRNLPKKWREKDKISLFEKIKHRYLQLMKLRLSLSMIDPASKLKKQQERL